MARAAVTWPLEVVSLRTDDVSTKVVTSASALCSGVLASGWEEPPRWVRSSSCPARPGARIAAGFFAARPACWTLMLRGDLWEMDLLQQIFVALFALAALLLLLVNTRNDFLARVRGL